MSAAKDFWGYRSFYINDQRPQYPAILHDLRLQVLASTPQSSSLKHLWSTRISGMWQALSSRLSFDSWWIIEAGQTWSDMALVRFICFPFCTSCIIHHTLNLCWFAFTGVNDKFVQPTKLELVNRPNKNEVDQVLGLVFKQCFTRSLTSLSYFL